MITGICKLCGETKKLCNSHIIPESFLLRNKKDPENRDWLAVKDKRIDYLNYRTGLTDNTILCEGCDNKIGVFDKYAKELLYDIVPKKDKIDISGKNDFQQITVDGKDFNYEIFKKFLISLLWRAHVSCVDDCNDVDLGKYGAIAKDILNNNVFIDNKDFFCPIIFRRKDNDVLSKVSYISRTKFDGQKSHIFKIPHYDIIITTNIGPIEQGLKDNLFYKFLNEKRFSIVETTHDFLKSDEYIIRNTMQAFK